MPSGPVRPELWRALKKEKEKHPLLGGVAEGRGGCGLDAVPEVRRLEVETNEQKDGRRRRLRFFDRGNTRCPICLTSFTRDAVAQGQNVTLEHAPPKTLGGSEMCLTCTTCNSSAGGKLDQAAAMMNRAMVDRTAGRGTKVEVDVCGTKHTTYLSPDGGMDPESIRRRAGSSAAKQLREQAFSSSCTRGKLCYGPR